MQGAQGQTGQAVADEQLGPGLHQELLALRQLGHLLAIDLVLKGEAQHGVERSVERSQRERAADRSRDLQRLEDHLEATSLGPDEGGARQLGVEAQPVQVRAAKPQGRDLAQRVNAVANRLVVDEEQAETTRASALGGAGVDDREAVAAKSVAQPLFPRQVVSVLGRSRGRGHGEQIAARRRLGQGDRDMFPLQHRAGQHAPLRGVAGQPDHGRAQDGDRVDDGDGQIAPSYHADQRAHLLEAPELTTEHARHVAMVESNLDQPAERAARIAPRQVFLHAARVGELLARVVRITEFTIEPLCTSESVHASTKDSAPSSTTSSRARKSCCARRRTPPRGSARWRRPRACPRPSPAGRTVVATAPLRSLATSMFTFLGMGVLWMGAGSSGAPARPRVLPTMNIGLINAIG
jgi:hypothetical protein